MKFYHSKYSALPGTSLNEVLPLARKEFHIIQKRNPRRQPYIRSAYFKKDKIFINLYWEHLAQKHRADKVRRLKFYKCSIDLLRNTTITPEVVLEHSQLLYRFYGESADGRKFCVQVKMEQRTGRKDFISAFPTHDKK